VKEITNNIIQYLKQNKLVLGSILCFVCSGLAALAGGVSPQVVGGVAGFVLLVVAIILFIAHLEGGSKSRYRD